MSHAPKFSLAALVTVFIVIFTAACGNGGNNASDAGAGSSEPGNVTASPSDSPSADSAGASKGPIKVTFWHSMGGDLQKVVDQMVQDFNSSHPDIQVEAVYQGSYDESLNKLKATMGSKDGPSIVQVYEIGTRFMIDSKAITPVQDFVDRENYDLTQLEPNITGYYSIGGRLYSMPFNTSNPILYYNKDVFKQAGLDPEKPPRTYDEVAQAAEKISKSTKVKGASFAIYGWFMEQFFANQGVDYVNNGNGREAPATTSNVADEAGVKTLTWWKSMLDSGAAINLGRNTADTKKAFIAGQIGMTLDSTAALRSIVDGAQGKFEVGTAFLPKPADAKEGGVVVGGASLWILNNRPAEEQKAAWEFIKFLASPKEQGIWSVNSGYFPITKAAYDEQVVKDNLQKFPQFQTAIDQLHQTKLSTATQGAVMGVFPEARQIVEGAIESVVNNQKTPKQALDDAAKEITGKIQTYNSTVK